MSTATNMIWDIMSQKFAGKLVRHENCRDREADGAIHWRVIRQKLKFTFMKQGRHTFTDRDWV